ALDAVNARFKFQLREDASTGNRSNDLLIAAGIAFAGRDDLDLPALLGGIAIIHAEEIAGKDRRLVPASAGADFEDRVLLVGGILREEEHLQLSQQAFNALFHVFTIDLG